MKFTRKYSVFVLFLTFLLGSLVVLPGTTGAVPATLSMSPNKAAPGANVTANGGNFMAGETVDVSFNGQPVGQPTVNPQGNFALSFQVPNLAAGDYGVAATGRGSQLSASTTFTVQPGIATLTFSVDQAPPGTAIVISGTGFLGGENVMVSFNGPTIATLAADTNGNFGVPFTIPQLAAGTYIATATGQTSSRTVNENFIVLIGPTPQPTTQPTAQPTAQPTTTPVPTAPPIVHDDRYFGQTGYRIDNDQIWAFFNQFGGIGAFGFPTSRTVAFLGCPVQFFQRQVIQICPTQGAALINILDPDIFPYTRVNGSVFPGPDPVMKANTPQVSDPMYAQKITQFVIDNVPNTWNGLPVNFLQTFNTLGGLTIWGAPISQPAPDPTNANFVYQRFQRGIMHFIAPSTTESILLADYLKAIILDQNVPPDLLQESSESRYFNQYCPGQPLWLCRPAELPGTDFTFGFVQG